MELLQQTSTRLVNWLREMTATARTALAVIALLFLAGAALLIRSRETRTDHYLLGGRSFQPAELARIETAFSTAKMAAKVEGLPIGISSGAALAAGIEVAQRKEMKNKKIIIVIPSFAERYLSTPLFN